MILILDESHFTLTGGVYYSVPFQLEELDNFMSVEVTLTGNGSVDIDQSIDETTWFATIDTTFDCAPSGLQTFSDCQPKLYFRLRSVTEFVSARILL